jgi:hypothetical protein
MPRPAITRINGGLQVAPITTNKNNGFYPPQLTTAQRDAIPAGTLANGTAIYNTTTNTFQTYATYATGANATTSAWLPLGSIPVMTAAQGVFFEAANAIPGQMYLQTDAAQPLKIHGGAAWRTIATV